MRFSAGEVQEIRGSGRGRARPMSSATELEPARLQQPAQPGVQVFDDLDAVLQGQRAELDRFGARGPGSRRPGGSSSGRRCPRCGSRGRPPWPGSGS